MMRSEKFRSLGKWDRFLQAICYAAFSAAAIFLFLRVYDCFRCEKISKTPKELLAASELARNHIEKEYALDLESKPYDELARRSMEKLSAEPYLTGVWAPPLWEYRLRSAPELFPVESLLASAGYGAFSVNANARESRSQHLGRDATPVQNRSTQGYHWAIVTGVIEYRKQLDAFFKAVEGAEYRNPALDVPDYLYFEVERAEVAGMADDEKLSWERQPVRSMYDMKNCWSGVGNDPVDAKYFPPAKNGVGFVFPLGPLAGGSWKDEAGHPRIASYEAALRQKSLIRPVSAAAREDDAFGFDANAAVSPRHRIGDLGAKRTDGILAGAEKPDILFFRYIDYDVQPNKKYCYRVRLIVQNLNWNVPKIYLATEELGAARSMKTAWSRPTPIISTPPETKIELVSADVREKYAKVRLVRFDLSTGGNQTKEFKVERGELMNYPREEYYSSDDSSTGYENEYSHLIPSLRKPPKPRLVDFITNETLIEIHAGVRLPGRQHQTTRSSIIVMDREGNRRVIEEAGPIPARPAPGRVASAGR